MTPEGAREIVRRLDPDYAAQIEKAGFTADAARYIWLGAVRRDFDFEADDEGLKPIP